MSSRSPLPSDNVILAGPSSPFKCLTSAGDFLFFFSNILRLLALLVAACLPLGACQKSQDVAEEEGKSPAEVKHLNGEDGPAQITLSEEAVKRIDVQTADVQDIDVNGAKQKIMPYAALLYDTEGETWTFTNPEPQTYVRQKIKVDRIDGDKVILAQGPAAGTKVVTVGVAELYGSEEEFEEE